MHIRKAEKRDATALAELINLAGEGIPFHLWQRMKSEDQTTLEFGALRAAREEGGFSYTHAWVADQGHRVAGMVLGYPQPDPYELDDIEEFAEFIQPVVRLEAEAPGSWYLNAVATFESFRRKGLGERLMDFAEDIARREGCGELSLVVASPNQGARMLYAKLGYNLRASQPIINFPGFDIDGDWLLMVKDI